MNFNLKRAAAIVAALLTTAQLFATPTGCDIMVRWNGDKLLGPKFQCHTVRHDDDYSGEVISTIIRRTPLLDNDRAILYVHGYNDYFFQEEMANRFYDSMWNFYAIDLRKYGRSMLDHQQPFEVLDLKEYFADIDRTLALMWGEGFREIILMGHSTGGLITTLYCKEIEKQEQESATSDSKKRVNATVKGLILNSPFLEMNMGWFARKVGYPIIAAIGRIAPQGVVSQGKSTAYFESLQSAHNGEWEYDPELKFAISPPVTLGWINAIYQGHRTVQRTRDIDIPILLLYSDNTVSGKVWSEKFQHGDCVLNVDHIKKYGSRLGENVTAVEINGGMHDLILSSYNSREQAYTTIFDWLKEQR
ncbi:MAG: alpha/beta hydrolase [Rikenellaceae bacterium]